MVAVVLLHMISHSFKYSTIVLDTAQMMSSAITAINFAFIAHIGSKQLMANYVVEAETEHTLDVFADELVAKLCDIAFWKWHSGCTDLENRRPRNQMRFSRASSAKFNLVCCSREYDGQQYRSDHKVSSRRQRREEISRPQERMDFPLRDVQPPSPSPSTVRYTGTGFRLVRCMPHLKRREADAALSAGRVLVNGELVRPSQRVRSGDVVTLDGEVMQWEAYAQACEAEVGETSRFMYLKYNKPRGVVCTMEKMHKDSMLYVLPSKVKELRVRLFPIGRLDKDSSGLVLLTNDGRIPQALLDSQSKVAKIYEVHLDKAPAPVDVKTLAAGVEITTRQQRGGVTVTAVTRQCVVKYLGGRTLLFVLEEGRNRQIRKMCEAVGYEVRGLHRTQIGRVELGRLPPGQLEPLAQQELAEVQAAVAANLARKALEVNSDMRLVDKNHEDASSAEFG